jgi:hypothetical protein
VRIFPGHCPLPGVEIMPTVFWRLVLSLFSHKNRGDEISTHLGLLNVANHCEIKDSTGGEDDNDFSPEGGYSTFLRNNVHTVHTVSQPRTETSSTFIPVLGPVTWTDSTSKLW